MKQDFLYNAIAGKIARQIRTGVLKSGERLPSVRMLCQEHGIGINTAKRIFMELESQSLIYSKPQSGYFVNQPGYLRLPMAGASKPSTVPNQKEPAELISRVYSNMGRTDITPFFIGVPAGGILPLAKLKKEVVLATRELKEGGSEYELLHGNLKLRRMVAVRSLSWGGELKEDDLITTSGGMNALAFCLMAITKPGDTIAVESPCYPGILQLAVSQRLKVLEVATHPATGIDLDALKKVIPKIKACLLVPNFNTPLGSCMPDENKKEVVELMAKHNIPIIEDDVYGDLYFGGKRPLCCKSFDKEGNVLWCSSVSKTLAPGYRVGFVAPGKYQEEILKLKLVHSISSTSVIHETVGNFLKTGRYENHLRKLRKTLQENYVHYVNAIAEYFPEDTKTSRPQGGLALWVELNKNIDTTELFEVAMKKKICIAPGRMFTLQNQFQNCMRLCTGLQWTDELKFKLKQLGDIAKMLS